MQEELLLALALVLLDDLGVALGAEGDRGERLRLAAGEERRAVGAGQHADLDVDGADLVELARVEAVAVVEDRVVERLFLERLDDLLGLRALGRVVLRDRAEIVLLDRRDGVLALELALRCAGRP